MTSKTPNPDPSFESKLRRSITERLTELDSVLSKHLADTATRTAEIHDERKRLTASLAKLAPHLGGPKPKLKSPRKRGRTPARKSTSTASA